MMASLRPHVRKKEEGKVGETITQKKSVTSDLLRSPQRTKHQINERSRQTAHEKREKHVFHSFPPFKNLRRGK